MKNCLICNKTLSGRQSKYCSTKCKNQDSNNKHQNYVSQQERGLRRRIDLINFKGGKCEICSYNNNYSSLCFHHLDPSTKSFQIDLRKCSNSTWENLLEEVNKCQLLCHNCHNEIHHPSLRINPA